jgi:hypothetical protein
VSHEFGKHFTVVINKVPTRVTIRTQLSRIEGVLHLHPNNRLLDEVNKERSPFVAITQATISADGEEIRLPFMVLRKDTIEWIYPIENQIKDQA